MRLLHLLKLISLYFYTNMDILPFARGEGKHGGFEKTVPRLYFLIQSFVYDVRMSTAHRTAVIYGNTLFLEGIAEVLRSLPGMNVIERKPVDGGALFMGTRPDVVLIDAAQISFPQMEQLIESFPTKPCPPFVRMNASEQELTVHSMQNLPAATLADLARVIEKICGA
jgi:hypothetical protein